MEMKYTCSDGSCKTSDKIWGIVKGNKLYRLTFSKSLAEHICQKHGYELRRMTFHIGKPLKVGEKSKTSLYGIRSSNNGIILRVSMFREIAEEMRDTSRQVHEIYLE
jgi:hypothetical protein